MRTLYLSLALLVGICSLSMNSAAQTVARDYADLSYVKHNLVTPVYLDRVYLAEWKGKYGLIKYENKEVLLPCVYDTILPLDRPTYKYCNRFAVVKNGKYGVVQLSYKDTIQHLLQPKYDYIETGNASVSLDYSSPYAYDGPHEDEEYGYAPATVIIPRLAKLGDKYGYIDDNFEEMCLFAFDDATAFSSNMAAVKMNEKWGYVNDTFAVVIPYKYEYAKPFYGNEAVVTVNGAQGKINKQDSITLKPQFDEIIWNNSKITMFRLGSEWGIMDKKGRVVLSPVYEEIGENSWYHISVKKNGKYGLIDMDFKEVLTPIYDKPVSPTQLQDFRFAHVVVDGNFGIINRALEVVCPPLYDKMSLQNLKSYRNTTEITKGGKVGLLDYKGKVMVEPYYEEISWMNTINMYRFQENGLIGVLDSTENVVIPAQFHDIGQASNTLFQVKLNGMIGRYDLQGKEVLPLSYDWIYQSGDYFHIGLNGKKGIATKKGEVIIPLQFDEIWMFRDTFGIAHKGGKWGFFNRKGEWIVPPRYDQIKMIRGNEVVVKIDGKCGFVNRKGEETLPVIYDKTVNIHMLYDYGFMRVTLNGKSGIIDTTYKLILPIEYDHMTHAQISKSMRKNNCIFLQKDGKIGMLHRSGKVVPCQYDDIRTGHYVPGDVFIVTKDGLHGVVDSLGKVIVPFDSTYISIGRTSHLEGDGESHEQEVIYIRKSGKYHLIYNDKGKLIAKEQFTWVFTKKDYGTRFTFKYREGNYYLSPKKRWVKIHYSGKG